MASFAPPNPNPYQAGLRPAHAGANDARLPGVVLDVDRRDAARPSFPERDRHLRIAAEATRILDDVRHAVERNPQGAHAAALRLVTLLSPPAEAEAATARGGLAPWQKRKVDRYLREHLERPLRVSELADQVSLSVSHFCRAFKETFGESPHAYLIRLRLQLAQQLMLATEDPLSQIALASGLADQAHLCKLFRRGVGETPSAWRRRNVTDAQADARRLRATVAA